jgi:N-acetylmuramic acid 6-phosphate (MurNAc-6-P) etherase
MSDLDDLIERLRAVSEDLADRAIAILSEATRSGATQRPAEERTLTQARRAVEKAINLLERSGQRRDDVD